MPTERVFLDTSGWVALLNTRDTNHSVAVNVSRVLANRQVLIVTTDWIIAETGNGLAGSPIRQGFVQAARYRIGSVRYQIVAVDGDLLNRALDLYASRPDKTWGLVDCPSFLVMQDLGITETLTADHHCQQAGFRALLRAESSTNRTDRGSD